MSETERAKELVIAMAYGYVIGSGAAMCVLFGVFILWVLS